MTTETKFTNLYDLQKYFSSEEVCRRYLEQFRWNGKISCPFCGSTRIYKLGDGKTYKCASKECYKKFTATVGTIFENTKIPLSKWFVAMYLITSHKKGISSLQLHRDIGVTQKTAWFINHRIREMLLVRSPELLSNMVEIDETYIGGKDSNRHKSKRKGKTGQGDKLPVLGLLERKKGLILRRMLAPSKEFLLPIIKENVKKASTIVTDNWSGYNQLKKDYKHKVVSHSTDIYLVEGIYHTNTIEGFWSLLKRGIYGIYHSVSDKHLDRYLTEFEQRYNTRHVSEVDRFNDFLGQCEGRLKYRNLINKRSVPLQK